MNVKRIRGHITDVLLFFHVILSVAFEAQLSGQKASAGIFEHIMIEVQSGIGFSVKKSRLIWVFEYGPGVGVPVNWFYRVSPDLTERRLSGQRDSPKSVNLREKGIAFNVPYLFPLAALGVVIINAN